ncbi:flavodoxin family protein [Anaeromicrobium sediminis]|uniref:Flavodoxin n=1 Tax=Anaeromicrobium sediminis TaxID=1478221 RepID=A0A267MLR9_9FIRM|nr:flavodoxin [Anaeromicrobium sediminis]PAB60554.1 flavodoxin [Anaeromicrobium sediminis]
MKKLVVFYSFEGNTKYIAEGIAKEVGADLLELKPLEEPKKSGFMKYFWGGKQVMTKKIPELESIDKNPNDYDLIYMGTPVWAWSYAPAFRAFLSKVNIKNKNIALFCCHGGGKGKVFERFKEDLGENKYLGQIDFQDPLKNNKDKDLEEAKKWAKEIKESII